MYLIRGQLQAAADAGALAGVYDVAQGWTDSTGGHRTGITRRATRLERRSIRPATSLSQSGHWNDTTLHGQRRFWKLEKLERLTSTPFA